MAASEAGSATQFEFYEGIRILIPGALAVGLTTAVGRTFGVTAPSLTNNTLGGVVAAVLIGLVFYYVDAPAKATVFAKGLPTEHLKELGVKPVGGKSMLNMFFVLSDEVMPASIKNRALYMGSMYRIGFEAIYLMVFYSVSVLNFDLYWSVRGHRLLTSGPSLETIVAVGIGILLMVPVAYVFDKGRKHSGRDTSKPPDGSSDEGCTKSRQAVCSWLVSSGPELGVALLAVVVQMLWFNNEHRFIVLAMAGNLVCVACWGVRYFRGRTPSRGVSRTPLGRLLAVTLLSLALVPTFADCAERLPQASSVSSHVAFAWLLVLLTAAVLVCSRGHEKRLGGAYATQNAWIDLHLSELKAIYFSPKESPIVLVGNKTLPEQEGH